MNKRLFIYCMLFIGCMSIHVSGEHPDHAVSNHLIAAVENIEYIDFEKAAMEFRKAKDGAAKGSEQWQKAVYGLGVCLWQKKPSTEASTNEAAELFQLLLSESPDSCYAARTMMNLGRIAELSDYYQDKMDLAGAREWYQKVVVKWAEEPIGSEATLRIAATYIQTYDESQVKRGIAIIEKWLKAKPTNEFATIMWQYLGDTYFYPLKNYARSLECYEKADEIGFVEKGREGAIYWRMAVMAERYLKNREKAVKYYTKIISVVPTSGKAYESQLALKRLGAPVPVIDVIENLKKSGKPAVKKPQESEAN